MINQYGADAVRWFILSDSPPEKDVQWSDTGVASANKFLQKIWDLNCKIATRKEKKITIEKEKKFNTIINSFVNKIDISIKEFKFNVSIAYFYEVFKILRNHIESEISNENLKNNITKINKLMIPFTPHLAYENLELLKCETTNNWPKIEKNSIEEVKLAVQINGKTRDIIEIKKDTIAEDIMKIVSDKSKAKKYIANKKIFKTIFVKNKIVNYIIKD